MEATPYSGAQAAGSTLIMVVTQRGRFARVLPALGESTLIIVVTQPTGERFRSMQKSRSTLIIVVTQREEVVLVDKNMAKVNSYHSCYSTLIPLSEKVKGFMVLIIVVTQLQYPPARRGSSAGVNSYHSCYSTLMILRTPSGETGQLLS